MTYINAELRRFVLERAENCCEYCLLSQENNFLPFEVDHIVSEKHGGETSKDNLCLSCSTCNRFKGSDIGSYDRVTGSFVGLYNPRLQSWSEHFRLDTALIEPLTPEGRVTVFLLKLNLPERIEERRGLIVLNQYPCPSIPL